MDTFPERSQGGSTFESLSAHHMLQVYHRNWTYIAYVLPTPAENELTPLYLSTHYFERKTLGIKV